MKPDSYPLEFRSIKTLVSTRPATLFPFVMAVSGCNDGLKDARDAILAEEFCFEDIPLSCPVTDFSGPMADTITSDFRAMHIGTEAKQAALVELLANGGAAAFAPGSVYDEHFQFLSDSNVEWVGINVALLFDGTPEAATVQLNRTPASFDDRSLHTHTYPASVLSIMVSELKSRGFKVMLNFALEPTASPGDGSAIAQAAGVRENIGVAISDWPTSVGVSPNASTYFWDPSYDPSQRAAKIDAFWQSYEDSIVEVIGDICDPGVDPTACPELVSIGTESNGLFRSDADWIPSIQGVVNTLRSGTVLPSATPLTFGAMDSLYSESRFAGTRTIWTTLNLDYVGIDSYPPADNDEGPDLQCTYELGFYENVYNPANGLKKLVTDNDLPVLFLELGWADTKQAAQGIKPAEGSTPHDGSDGASTQSNLISAFFSLREACDDMVLGGFLWNNSFATTTEWQNYKNRDGFAAFGIRPYYTCCGDLQLDMFAMNASHEQVAFFYGPGVWESAEADAGEHDIPGFSSLRSSDSGSPQFDTGDDSGSPADMGDTSTP